MDKQWTNIVELEILQKWNDVKLSDWTDYFKGIFLDVVTKNN